MLTSSVRRAGAVVLCVTTGLLTTPAVADAAPGAFAAPESSRFVLLSGCARPDAPDLNGEWTVTAEYAVEFTGGRYSIPVAGGESIEVGGDDTYRARIDQTWIHDRAGWAALGPGSTSDLHIFEVHAGDPGDDGSQHVIHPAEWVTVDAYTCLPI